MINSKKNKNKFPLSYKGIFFGLLFILLLGLCNSINIIDDATIREKQKKLSIQDDFSDVDTYYEFAPLKIKFTIKNIFDNK